MEEMGIDSETEVAADETGEMSPAALVTEAGQEYESENLSRLRTWSIVAGFVLAFISGFGGWALSGIILRPIRDITQVASEISATNLSQRINHEGPDDELKDLADTFDSMIERIERGFASQQRFVQDASHELRTPLAAIRTNIEVAELAQESDVDPEEQHELLETVKGQTERLTRLSEDLLLLTTPHATVPLETVEPRELVGMAIEEIEPLAGHASVRIAADLQDSCQATGNSELLYHCVRNLIENAVKHTGKGASVEVKLGSTGEGVWIQVRDDGPGIPAEHQAHVFERFYRVDQSRARGQGGSGLGLAIVHELMDSMGGAVEVESAAGKGATFTLRLPHAAPANGVPPQRNGVPGP